MVQEIFIGRSYYLLADLMIELSLIGLACRHSLSVALLTFLLAASRGSMRADQNSRLGRSQSLAMLIRRPVSAALSTEK